MTHDLNHGIAKMLRSLRARHSLSVKKISNMLYIDDHTWSRYESGASTPTASELITIYHTLGDSLLSDILPVVYPGIYDSDTVSARERVSHFVNDIAADTDISSIAYIMYGNHGSNPSAQIAMLAMIDHLPMDCRVAIASLINSMYLMAEHRGELVGMDQNIPNTELFRTCLTHGTAAANDRRESYHIKE